MRHAVFAILLAAPLFAQQDPQPVSKPMQELRAKVVVALARARQEMARKGMKNEAGDCDAIAAKVTNPHKTLSATGASTGWPGDDAYEEVLKAWAELGNQLSTIEGDAAAGLEGKEKEEAQRLAGWFASWEEVGKGIRHLNQRRKACKLGPVTECWAGSLGGYLHGLYLQTNANDPSTAGLGAHNEEKGRPGWSVEGSEAAGGILGGGGAEYVMDSWCGSRFHREPVLNATVGRVSFGGLPTGWWSCRSAGGTPSRNPPDVLIWPGDGDTDIEAVFHGEAPDPFPPGVTSSGTLVYAQFTRNPPRKPIGRILDPDGKEVETLVLDKHPLCFVAKDALKPGTKYTVQILGQDGFKFTSTFTTK